MMMKMMAMRQVWLSEMVFDSIASRLLIAIGAALLVGAMAAAILFHVESNVKGL